MDDLIYDAGRKFSTYRRLRQSSIAAGNECNNQRTAIQDLKAQLATMEEAYALGKKNRAKIVAEETKAYTDMQSTGRILIGQARDVETVAYLRNVKKFNPEIYCLTQDLVTELGNMGLAAQIFPPPEAEEGNPPGNPHGEQEDEVEDEVEDEDEEMHGNVEEPVAGDDEDEDEDDDDFDLGAEDVVDDEIDGDFEDLVDEDDEDGEDSADDGSGN